MVRQCDSVVWQSDTVVWQCGGVVWQCNGVVWQCGVVGEVESSAHPYHRSAISIDLSVIMVRTVRNNNSY